MASKCEQLINSIEVKFRSKKFSELVQVCEEYFELNHKLLSAIVDDLGVSTSSSSSSTTLNLKPSEDMDKLNKKLKIYLNKLVQFIYAGDETPADETNFKKLLLQLVNYFLFSNQPLSTSAAAAFKLKFSSSLRTCVDLLEKFLFAFNEKLSLEYALDYPSNVTTVDECLVSYVSQLKQSLAQLGTLTDTANLIELIDTIKSDMKEELNTSGVEATNHVAENVVELDTLKEQLAKRDADLRESNEKFDKLKEKYDAEYKQLGEVKVRLEKLQSQYLELEEKEKQQEQEIINLRTSLSNVESTHTPVIIVSESNSKQPPEANITENQPSPPTPKSAGEKPADLLLINCNSNTQTLVDTKLIENHVIEAYVKQIETLNKRIQYLDSISIYYYEEIKSFMEQLKYQTDVNKLQENDINEIKDQLERTRTSYENQMSTMSDHLIEMTDRMTKQADDNEKLKHELNQMMSINSSSSTNNNSSKNSTKSTKKK